MFLVRDMESPNKDRLLALKILLPSLASNDDFVQMFEAEAKLASRLKHDNVVSIAGFGKVRGVHCLAMEYVFGASLAQVLRASARAKKPLTVGVLLRITASVCDALHYAHERRDAKGSPMDLVHRDVTPQNILIGFSGKSKLTDFGIAKATGRGWETQAGIVKGKFSYMSPEQALGKRVDRRSDIFGAGIVLWEALTGRDLFKGSTAMDVLTAIREQRIDPPSKVVPGLTPIVDPIVMKALRRSPKQRYQTAAEMRDEILELIRRAGVDIDEQTIRRELAAIYGGDIDARAIQVRRAKAGKADLEALAKVLGGQVLSSKYIPVIPGGETRTYDLDHGHTAPTPVPPPPQYGSDDLMSEVFQRPMLDGVDTVDGDGLTDWNEGNSDADGQDEVLSMISEEDATIGHIPQAFHEKFGRTDGVLAADAVGFDDDEATVGLPAGAELSPMRGISDDPSGDWSDPPAYYDEPPRARVPNELRQSARLEPVPSPTAEADRPVPRAPSLDLDDERGAPPPTPTPDLDDQTISRPPPPPASEAPPSPLEEGAAIGDMSALPRPRATQPTGVQMSWVAFSVLIIGLLGIGYAAGLLLPRPF